MWITKHKNLALAIGTALASLILVYVAVLPIYRNGSELLGQIKTRSTELESSTNKVSILSKLDPNVLKERVNVLDSALPPRKDVLLYLTSIDGLSRELGLTFGGLELAPGDITEASGSAQSNKRVQGVQSLDTELKMSGGQESIYTFLRTIEGVLPLMLIKDVNVSILGNEQYSLALTLSMLWAEPATIDVKGPVTLFGAEEDKYFQQLSQYRRFDTVIIAAPVDGNKSDLFAPYSSSLTTSPSSTPIPTPTPTPAPTQTPIIEPTI